MADRIFVMVYVLEFRNNHDKLGITKQGRVWSRACAWAAKGKRGSEGRLWDRGTAVQLGVYGCLH